MTDEGLSPKRRLDNVREQLANLRQDLENARGGFGWSAPDDDPTVKHLEEEITLLEEEQDRLWKQVMGKSAP